jgi:hypothetical protein
MDIELVFENGYVVSLSMPANDWPIFSGYLENWESVRQIEIRETGATVWTVLDPAELTGTI